MVVVPAFTPVTIPVEPIVPTAGAPLLHTPPGVALDSVVAPPLHTVALPVIAAGLDDTKLSLTPGVACAKELLLAVKLQR
jgi:hypothetical protein